jgi:hypothetical protein
MLGQIQNTPAEEEKECDLLITILLILNKVEQNEKEKLE